MKQENGELMICFTITAILIGAGLTLAPLFQRSVGTSFLTGETRDDERGARWKKVKKGIAEITVQDFILKKKMEIIEEQAKILGNTLDEIIERLEALEIALDKIIVRPGAVKVSKDRKLKDPNFLVLQDFKGVEFFRLNDRGITALKCLIDWHEDPFRRKVCKHRYIPFR